MTEETAQDATAEAAPAAPEPAAPAPRRRRTPKHDALLAADVATARAAVEQIAEPAQIGPGHRVTAEEDRLVVHLFECALPGYRGWNWFASLARAPRSKAVTVCEVGLLPGEDALLAPEWVPWSARVSPEEKAQEEQDRAEEEAGENAAAGAPGGSGDAAGGDRAPEDRAAAEDGSVPPQEGERP
ncbi:MULTISPECIES: DUF3027 domain-containing protein [Kocuria]|uniref:DUF3027 domain-containing protein n=1 Tax=Kocuria rosea subsp. polaris TaxID=136273 RepID=A0A0W8I9G5_KOCRO|nr:DUF3027 domain-containing protein [Kocuria polaris]KUG56546.1 hypothetical protein AVL61_05650 [Kocuria polaris]